MCRYLGEMQHDAFPPITIVGLCVCMCVCVCVCVCVCTHACLIGGPHEQQFEIIPPVFNVLHRHSYQTTVMNKHDVTNMTVMSRSWTKMSPYRRHFSSWPWHIFLLSLPTFCRSMIRIEIIREDWMWQSCKRWQIEHTLLVPTHRKQYIGHRLMHLHLTLARSKGQDHIHFDCEYFVNGNG